MIIDDGLEALVSADPIINEDTIDLFENEKDPLHVERKQQQRAIDNNMILVALHYGRKQRTYQDISYTIVDRSLIGTEYEKFLSKLRGLTIIGRWEGKKFHLITSYWNFLVKSRKRY